MDLYRQEILDHYKSPRNFGPAPRGVKGTSHKETNASCGDEVEVWVEINKGKINNIGFTGQGCAISIAGTSLLMERLKGKKITQALKMKDEEMMELFGIKVNPARKKCATLGLVAVKKALGKS